MVSGLMLNEFKHVSVKDPVLEKRGIKIVAHDISISFKRNTTIQT